MHMANVFCLDTDLLVWLKRIGCSSLLIYLNDQRGFFKKRTLGNQFLLVTEHFDV